ncbi:hypothetical protein BDD12DRAFT_825348, partial [Trichophaea hybrida]
NAERETSSERKTVTLEREEISSGHATTMDSLVTSRLIAFTTNKFKRSILKLRKPASDRELLWLVDLDIPQGYQVDALYIPTIRLSLLSINQIDSAGYMATFGSGKMLHIVTAITANHCC